jgi:AcrR family transcriptional regulator
MPRAPGQIDEGKREAILEAAAAVFAERGLSAPLEAIAKHAGVSKQTLYNRFGSREELLRQMVEERRSLVTAALDMPGAEDDPEETLARFAQALLERYAAPQTAPMMRVAIAAACEQASAARTLFEAGPKASRIRLAAYLRRETELGRLDAPEPDAAAEMFVGMVSGHMMLGLLLNAKDPPDDGAIADRARECARRFCRAFAPKPD